jgi:hypothetical protein
MLKRHFANVRKCRKHKIITCWGTGQGAVAARARELALFCRSSAAPALISASTIGWSFLPVARISAVLPSWAHEHRAWQTCRATAAGGLRPRARARSSCRGSAALWKTASQGNKGEGNQSIHTGSTWVEHMTRRGCNLSLEEHSLRMEYRSGIWYCAILPVGKCRATHYHQTVLHNNGRHSVAVIWLL